MKMMFGRDLAPAADITPAVPIPTVPNPAKNSRREKLIS